MYAFLGPYAGSTLDPTKIEGNFPSCEGHKPMIFWCDPLNMSFMKHRIFRSSSSATHTPPFLKWLEKVKVHKAQVCKNLGIFNLIQLSKTGLEYDEQLILAAMHF